MAFRSQDHPGRSFCGFVLKIPLCVHARRSSPPRLTLSKADRYIAAAELLYSKTGAGLVEPPLNKALFPVNGWALRPGQTSFPLRPVIKRVGGRTLMQNTASKQFTSPSRTSTTVKQLKLNQMQVDVFCER